MTVSNAEYIIEWHQVTPELLERLIREYGDKKCIKGIFLTKTNKEEIIRGFIKNPAPDDWVITGTKDREKTFPKIAEMIADYSEYFETEAKKYGFKVFNMDNDFDNQINKAIEYLISA